MSNFFYIKKKKIDKVMEGLLSTGPTPSSLPTYSKEKGVSISNVWQCLCSWGYGVGDEGQNSVGDEGQNSGYRCAHITRLYFDV